MINVDIENVDNAMMMEDPFTRRSFHVVCLQSFHLLTSE